jgi:uncharacterized protein YxjI
MLRRHQSRGPTPGGSTGERYQMKQRLISFGDDFYIENEHGQQCFKVDGKALRIRNTLIFEDMQGRELATIQEKMVRVKDTMDIERDGRVVASVKKALLAPLRERYTLNIHGGPDMEIQGNILDHEYRIERGRQPVAEISKKWFRVRDTYGVEVAPGEDAVLLLAATVAVDEMAHATH